jgi:hypothetical protein
LFGELLFLLGLDVPQDRNTPDHQKLIGVADTFTAKLIKKRRLPLNRFTNLQGMESKYQQI